MRSVLTMIQGKNSGRRYNSRNDAIWKSHQKDREPRIFSIALRKGPWTGNFDHFSKLGRSFLSTLSEKAIDSRTSNEAPAAGELKSLLIQDCRY